MTTETSKPSHDQNPSGVQKHLGSCHCGRVRFEVELDLAQGGSRCNCSICTKIAPVSGIVRPAQFHLLTDEAELSSYEWGGKISKRYFCRHCGVHCFGRGHLAEVGGDFVGVNLNTLDDVEISQLSLAYFDGRHNNWQAGTRPEPWPILG
jgi:hypothetical protein